MYNLLPGITLRTFGSCGAQKSGKFGMNTQSHMVILSSVRTALVGYSNNKIIEKQRNSWNIELGLRLLFCVVTKILLMNRMKIQTVFIDFHGNVSFTRGHVPPSK